MKKSKKKFKKDGEIYYKLYNEEGKEIGQIHPLYEKTQNNYLRGISLFILTKEGDLVLEKRGNQVELNSDEIDLVSGHCNNSEKGKETAYRELYEEVGIKKKKVLKLKKVKDKVPLKFAGRNFFISFYVTKLINHKALNKKNLQDTEVEDVWILPMQEGFDLIRQNKTKFPYLGNEKIFEEIFQKVELFYQKSIEKKDKTKNKKEMIR